MPGGLRPRTALFAVCSLSALRSHRQVVAHDRFGCETQRNGDRRIGVQDMALHVGETWMTCRRRRRHDHHRPGARTACQSVRLGSAPGPHRRGTGGGVRRRRASAARRLPHRRSSGRQARIGVRARPPAWRSPPCCWPGREATRGASPPAFRAQHGVAGRTQRGSSPDPARQRLRECRGDQPGHQGEKRLARLRHGHRSTTWTSAPLAGCRAADPGLSSRIRDVLRRRWVEGGLHGATELHAWWRRASWNHTRWILVNSGSAYGAVLGGPGAPETRIRTRVAQSASAYRREVAATSARWPWSCNEATASNSSDAPWKVAPLKPVRDGAAPRRPAR